MGWLRADTTVVPSDIKYPTDSGLLTKGIARIATIVGRLHAAGIAPRTDFVAASPTARQGAHRIASKLRRRSDDARADVLAITASLRIWPRPPWSKQNGCSRTPGGSRIGRCGASGRCSRIWRT